MRYKRERDTLGLFFRVARDTPPFIVLPSLLRLIRTWHGQFRLSIQVQIPFGPLDGELVPAGLANCNETLHLYPGFLLLIGKLSKVPRPLIIGHSAQLSQSLSSCLCDPSKLLLIKSSHPSNLECYRRGTRDIA